MIFEVSELNEQSKALLETHFSDISVQGEISQLTRHNSGHWYFTIKDAKASISCAMFRGANSRVIFAPQIGHKVILSGKVSLYTANGSYQFIANSMKLAGDGDLEAKFNALKEKLANEGLFDPNRKKKIPKFPQNIAIITSQTSAAWADIKNRIAQSGYFLCKFTIFNSLVQGELAAQNLIENLKKADKMGFDAIIIARGGGSKEDLWCFNDEMLARAIAAAQTPIISGVGHEIDYTICDFVADHRSITPTATIDDLLPAADELRQGLDGTFMIFKELIELKFRAMSEILTRKSLEIRSLSVEHKLNLQEQNLKNLDAKLKSSINSLIANFTHNLDKKALELNLKNEFFKMSKNLVSVQKDGKKISLASLQSGDIITLSSQDDERNAQILE